MTSQFAPLRLFGPRISTYSRIASMVAEEKGAPWEIIPTDPKTVDHRQRHPYGRAPALEWTTPAGTPVRLYETIAIASFIDGQFGTPWALSPDKPLENAAMHQWISIVDQYMFRVIDVEFVLPAIVTRLTGQEPDDDRARKALGPMAYMFDQVESHLQDRPYFAGTALSLADIWMIALVDPLRLSGASLQLIEQRPAFFNWYERLRQHPSFIATEFDLSTLV